MSTAQLQLEAPSVARRIVAIDPGPKESGVVDYGEGRVLSCRTVSNAALIEELTFMPQPHLAIEMVASFGMAVGADVFETVRMIGRFQQAWHTPDDVLLVYRHEVKMYLCRSMKAKDANIRQRLIDLLGAPGTKAQKGATYGVSGHMWSALAVAVTAEAKLNGLAK
jgi:hypothetical protein